MKTMYVLLMLLAVGGFSFSAVVDFDTAPSDTDWAFDRVAGAAGSWTASGYTWGAVGTGGTGGLSPADNPAQLGYMAETYDLTGVGVVLTHSWDIQIDRAVALQVSANQLISVGVTEGATGTPGKFTHGLRARINYNPTNEAPAFTWYGETNVAGDLDAGIIDGHWYRVEAVYTTVGVDQLDYVYSAYELGTDGTDAPALISQATGTAVKAYLRDSTATVAAFKARVDHGGVAVDNFATSYVVPEPATITLLILGGIATMKRRKASRG